MKRIKLLFTIPFILIFVVGCGNSDKGNNANNDVIKTIMSRRSIRQYNTTPIPQEIMDVILECGINAPSGSNSQPWEIRVINNQDLLNEISEKMLSCFDSARSSQFKSNPNYRNMFRNATTVVFIANKDNGGKLDCGLLGENMILAAQSLGIGSCCLGAPINFFKTEIGTPYLKKLDFSPEYNLLYAIGFGYPEETPEAKPRSKEKIKYIYQ